MTACTIGITVGSFLSERAIADLLKADASAYFSMASFILAHKDGDQFNGTIIHKPGTFRTVSAPNGYISKYWVPETYALVSGNRAYSDGNYLAVTPDQYQFLAAIISANSTP